MVDIRKTLTEGTTSTGGYFVPDEYAKRFLELVQSKSVTLPLCENVRMRYDNMFIPTVATGNTAYFVSETGTITASDLTTGRIELTAKKIAALTGISTELMEDSDPAIGQVVSNQMATDVALKLDYEILNGDGTNFSGFRDTTTYTDMNTVTATADGAPITYTKIIDAQSEIQTDNFPGGTHMLMHPKELGMVRKLQDANSRPLFDEATFGSPLLAEKPNTVGTILGLKVVLSTQIPIDLTKGNGTALTDVIVITQNETGILGTRRNPVFHKDYVIENDYWKIQTNLRAAFYAKYQKSGCIIKDLTTA